VTRTALQRTQKQTAEDSCSTEKTKLSVAELPPFLSLTPFLSFSPERKHKQEMGPQTKSTIWAKANRKRPVAAGRATAQ
jgi:hypothetical protein